MAVCLLHAAKNVSATDKECVWVKRKAKTATMTVEELYPRRSVTQEDRDWFRAELAKSDHFKGICWILAPEPAPAPLPAPSAESIILSAECASVDPEADQVAHVLGRSR